MRIRRIPRVLTHLVRPQTTGFHAWGITAPGDLQSNWLAQMGFSREEIQELDFRQPMLQEILEYAGVRRGERLAPADIIRALGATVKVLQDHMRDLDSQIWMLQHRRDSLQRKAATVERMLRLLHPLPRHRAA